MMINFIVCNRVYNKIVLVQKCKNLCSTNKGEYGVPKTTIRQWGNNIYDSNISNEDNDNIK